MQAKTSMHLFLFLIVSSNSLSAMSEARQLAEIHESSHQAYIEKFIDSLKTEKDFQKSIYINGDFPALLEFAAYDNIENVKRILAKRPPLDKITNSDGENIFHILAKNGNSKLMRWVIKHCVHENIDISSAINGIEKNDLRTPLHVAARNSRTGCLKLLLHYGAKVDSLNNANNTPLHLAAASSFRGRHKRDHTVDILCRANAALAIKNKEDRTPQACAEKEKYRTTTAILRYYSLCSQLKPIVQDKKEPNYLQRLPLELLLMACRFCATTESIAPKPPSENLPASSL